MVNETISFSFGKNWESFIQKKFTRDRVETTKLHLLNFLGLPDLKGKYFLDIGCGSGLHSLAAFELGTSKIVSLDVDEFSVKTTEYLRHTVNEPQHWEVLNGSILDEQFTSHILPADIVYSWGVLHHTGAMWRACEIASKLVKPNGLLYIALYTTTNKSKYWINIKQKYNKTSEKGKRMMELWYILRHIILPLTLRRQNFIQYIQDYEKKRGMSFYTDVKDWLGGYPYEDATIEEVFNFFHKKFGFSLENIKTGEANTEYLFHRNNI